MQQAFIWKQTIDGQLQPFSAESANIQSQTDQASVYKPSAYKPCDQSSKKFVNVQKSKEFNVSTNVWTPSGYGTIKSIPKQEEKEQKTLSVKLLKQKNNKQQIVQVKQSQVCRKISINARIIDGQNVQLIKLQEISILTKIESLIGMISALKNQSSYLISAIAKSHRLDKKKTILDEQIGKNDYILFCLNSGKMSVFKRFKETNTSYWYIGSSWDAITFRSTKSLLVMGFGAYQHFHTSDFSIKFNIYVDDKQVLKVEDYKISSSLVKEKIGPVKFKNPIRIPSGGAITIQMMHMQVSGQGNHAYYGNNNDGTFQGNDSFITVQSSNKDQNCTSVSSGQIPQLHYIAT